MHHLKQHVRSASITMALALAMFGGCATQDEPTVDDVTEGTTTNESTDVTTSSDVSAQSFQIVWQCFTPGGARVGLPKSPLSACQAACPAPDTCTRCVWQNNALDCGE